MNRTLHPLALIRGAVLLLFSMLVSLGPLSNSALAQAPAINLAWNDCVDAPTATLDKTFACDANVGFDVMVVSFIAPSGIDQFVALEFYGENQSGAPGVIPAWWQLKGAGKCRNNALTASGDFTSYSACDASTWQGASTGGMGNIHDNDPVPGHQTWAGALSILGAANTLAEGVHYYGALLRLSHAKTVGSGRCDGCVTQMCIRLDRIRILRPSGTPAGDVEIRAVGTRAHVTWQSASDATCVGATHARNNTWGAIKALYR